MIRRNVQFNFLPFDSTDFVCATIKQIVFTIGLIFSLVVSVCFSFLRNAVVAVREAEHIARDTYASGLNDFNNVLDAQRSLLSLEDSLAISQGSVSGYMVTMYKTLGGGWAPFTDDSALQTAIR